MVKLCRIGGERTITSPINRFDNKWGCLGQTNIMSIISHIQYNFESLKQYYFRKPYICWCVQSHPEDRGDFGQGSTANISECSNQLELSVYNMWCSYMVLTNPRIRPRLEFIIMKIFIKIVKICSKSPPFTVVVLRVGEFSSTEYRFCDLTVYSVLSQV